MTHINKFINTILILGLSQGFATWLYSTFFPKTFFFITIFSHRDLGMCLSMLSTRILKIKNTYIDKLYKHLPILIIANQFYRSEMYHMQQYLVNKINNINPHLSLLIYYIPFAMLWAGINLARKICIDWKITENKKK